MYNVRCVLLYSHLAFIYILTLSMKHNVIPFNVLDVNLNLFLLTFVKISNKLIFITVKLLSTEHV